MALVLKSVKIFRDTVLFNYQPFMEQNKKS